MMLPLEQSDRHVSAVIYLLKVNNRNTKTRCEIGSKLTTKAPERRHWRRSDAFIVNFEHVIVGWGHTVILNFYLFSGYSSSNRTFPYISIKLSV